jgi:signal transduction histidine kinase
MLSVAGLLLCNVYRYDPSRPYDVILFCLCIYALYSLTIYVFRDTHFIIRGLPAYAKWVDMIFFSIMSALTGGADSPFFFFLFFQVFMTSYSQGFKDGLKTTYATAVLFVISVWLSTNISSLDADDVNETIVRTFVILIFGSIIAFWGKSRVSLNNRLKFLHSINTNWNPRFGINHQIISNLERLNGHYQANRSFIILEQSKSYPRYIMYECVSGKKNQSLTPKEIDPTTSSEFLVHPNDLSFCFSKSEVRIWGYKYLRSSVKYGVIHDEIPDQVAIKHSSIYNLLDEHPFLTVPFHIQGVASGRLYIISDKVNFTQEDISFTEQVSDTLMTIVNNMQLMESLIAKEGEFIRQRISLDVHDTTIQPYIGLTLALEALSREFYSNSYLNTRISEIINMANLTIKDLRSYKDTLRGQSLMRSDYLIASVRQQAERLYRFYKVQVDVQGSLEHHISGKIAEAAFQIIKEGLSNILRHTDSKMAFVTIKNTDTQLQIEIGNIISSSSSIPLLFMPKSIHERSLSLHGNVEIRIDLAGYTVVYVTLPLISD